MEEKERRLKIKKIEKYNEIIKKEKKEIVDGIVLTSLTAMIGALAITVFPLDLDFNKQTLEILTNSLLIAASAFGIGSSVYNFKGLVESICKKTLYEGKVNDLKTELDFDYDYKENSRGAK